VPYTTHKPPLHIHVVVPLNFNLKPTYCTWTLAFTWRRRIRLLFSLYRPFLQSLDYALMGLSKSISEICCRTSDSESEVLQCVSYIDLTNPSTELSLSQADLSPSFSSALLPQASSDRSTALGYSNTTLCSSSGTPIHHSSSVIYVFIPSLWPGFPFYWLWAGCQYVWEQLLT